jgi:hypothetical protein
LGRGHSENVKKYAEGKERGVTPWWAFLWYT